MSLPKTMEEYYQKVIQLQEQLRRSEEERLKLEMKFNEMLQMMKEEEEAHFKKLRSKYKKFLEEDTRRQRRNDKILEALDRIENRTVMWQAKTEKFKDLRKRYHTYIKQKQRPGDAEIFSSNPRQNIYETNSDDKNSFSSMKSKDTEEFRSRPQNVDDAFSKNKYSNLGNINSFYWKKEKEKRDLEKLNHADDSADIAPLKITKDLENSLKQSNKVSHPYFQNYPMYKNETIVNAHDKNHVSNETPEEIHTNLELMLNQYKDDTNANPQKKQAPLNIQEQNRKPLLQNQPLNRQPNNELIGQNKTNNDEETKDKQEKVAFKNMEQTLNKTGDNDSILPAYNKEKPITKFDRVEEQIRDNQGFEVSNDLKLQGQLNRRNIQPVKENNTNDQLLQSNVSEQPFDRNKHLKMENDRSALQYVEKERADGEKQVYHETGQLSQQYNESEQASQQYDENEAPLQHHVIEQEYNSNAQLQQQYDDNGQALQYDENGQPLQYDGNAPPLQCNENGQPLQYDDNGLPLQYDENGQPLQYDGNAQPLQYDDNGQPLQYDENGQPLQYDSTAQPLQYDENGQPLQYDDNAQPLQYDENGQPLQYDENGQPLQYDGTAQPLQYDDNGQPLQYDENEQPLQDDDKAQPLQYDENGQPLQYDENGQLLQYDGTAQPLQFDKNGQPLQYDENGQPLQYDENGQPLQYDENGQPLQYDENGQPLQYDENGQPLQYDSNTLQYDENGQPLQYDSNTLQYDENGQPLQYDENGQPLQYDENGQPLQYDGSVQPLQYDENGQPLQYDGNAQPLQYDENGQPLQYDENGQPLLYDNNGEVVPQYYDQNGQAVQYYNENDSVENVQQLDEMQKPVQDQAKIDTKSHVFDLLDTDTESTKHDTKISNDSDFNIGNNS